MPLYIIRNDITRMKVDAIVNAANSSLLGGGGVDGCIHRAAGPALLAECKTLGGCETGSARLTGAGNLPCKYVIHAVGPRWRGGRSGERELLASCYQTSLTLAKEKGCETVAFPLISSGIYGYPKAQALQVAVETIGSFLLDNDMTVYLVIFDRASYQISEKLFADIAAYIDDHYAEAHTDNRSGQLKRFTLPEEDSLPNMAPAPKMSAPPEPLRSPAPKMSMPPEPLQTTAPKTSWRKRKAAPQPAMPQKAAPEMPPAQAPAPPQKCPSLEEALRQIDESFSEMLLRKIDEAGMTDAQCYKKANIDRKLFSKIRSDRLYKPSKPTAIAFAIALELPLNETKDMLMKAGFALSHSNKFDIIIEYFIENKNYNILEINQALFAFDQNLLGA